jgi:hypothetical protein
MLNIASLSAYNAGLVKNLGANIKQISKENTKKGIKKLSMGLY